MLDRVRGAAGPATRPAGTGAPRRAVLFRSGQIPAIEEALRARGLPVEVVGLGGLLDTPEVRDVVCTLRVLADPTDGAALLRLLTGARWRIGPRDLVALHRRARALARGAAARRARRPTSRRARVADRLDDATLVEAMADLGRAAAYSAEGYARLRAYSRELGALRQRLDQPLPDLVADIERTIGLDVEVACAAGARATPAWPGPPGRARRRGRPVRRRHRRRARCAGFLAFLPPPRRRNAASTPGQVDVVEGAVQILTAHAAKGLEWDVVSVAGLPRASGRASSRRLRPLPDGHRACCRSRCAATPTACRLDLRRRPDQKDVAGALHRRPGWREHDEREERRLAYVAVTRPRRLLLCSGYWWGDGGSGRAGPSVFLDEIRATCADGAGVVDVWAGAAAGATRRPAPARAARRGRSPVRAGRRPGVPRRPPTWCRGAAWRAAGGPPTRGPDGAAGPPEAAAPWPRWDDDLRRSPRRRGRRRGRRTRRACCPRTCRCPSSWCCAATRRRWPGRCAARCRAGPPPYARRGTAFHAWLEQRFRRSRAARRRRAARRGRRRRGRRRGAGRAAGGVPARSGGPAHPVEVEVPFATTSPGWWSAGRMDAVFADPGGRFDVIDWKTGRRPPAPTPRPRRCSSPPTGSPGPRWPACRSSRSARRSTTSGTASPSARPTCSTPRGWPRSWRRAGRRRVRSGVLPGAPPAPLRCRTTKYPDDDSEQPQSGVIRVALDALVLAAGEVAEDDEAGRPRRAAEHVPGQERPVRHLATCRRCRGSARAARR